jgi:hypothetical protein
MTDEEKISSRAVQFVIDYEIHQGREVVDVQTNKGFKGFDLFSFSKDKSDIRTIEVKGTAKKNGIPDFFETEFTREKKLIATHLYVVYFETPQKPRLHIIPASEISPDDLKEKRGYRISSNFKTQKLKNYEV